MEVKSGIAGPSKITQDIQACSLAQQDELMALESILQPHELQVKAAAPGQARRLTLVLAPRLPAPTTVKVSFRPALPFNPPPEAQSEAKMPQQVAAAPSAVAPFEKLTSSSSSGVAATVVTSAPKRGRRRRNQRKRGLGQPCPFEGAPSSNPRSCESSHTIDPASPIESSRPASTACVSQAPPDSVIETFTLSHLPSITLSLQLPPLYPLHQPPHLESLSASWLSRAEEIWLAMQLRQQWSQSKAEILYVWTEWLLTGLWDQEQGGIFRSSTPASGEKDEAYLALSGDTLLPSLLSRHEKLATRSDFEGQRFGCGICLSERSGQRCARLVKCGHVFCQDCLCAYLGAMIREGMHRQAVACPDPDCTKARVESERERKADHQQRQREEDDEVNGIAEEELRLFVGDEATERWKWLSRKAEEEADPTAQHCPRKGCSGLARLDKAEVGTPYESMRLCPKCTYCWCAYCSAVWHRGQTCKLNASSVLVDEYKSYAEGSDARAQMERRFGKANLLRLVSAFEEQKANEAWLEGNSVQCPCCGVRIERSEGCAHLTCATCSTHMCWNCSKRLDPRDPYKHYNVPGQSCYGRLFPGHPGMMYEGQHQGPIVPGHDLALDEMLAWELVI